MEVRQSGLMIDLPPPDPSLEIVVASQGVSKGLRQTEGVQVLARAELGIGPLFLGTFIKNVTSATADSEAAVLVGLRGDVGGFALSGSAAYKWNMGDRGQADIDTVEFITTASRRIGAITPRLSLTYTPDDLGGTRESLYAELGAGYAIRSGTSASVAIGRRERDGGPDYTTFNAGVTQTLFRNVSADLRYYDTAQGDFGETYRSRVVLSARARF
jgi:uncharacterized protein (TIGR02001 family)